MGMMRIMLLHARLALGPWRRRIYALLYVGDEERELRCTHSLVDSAGGDQEGVNWTVAQAHAMPMM